MITMNGNVGLFKRFSSMISEQEGPKKDLGSECQHISNGIGYFEDKKRVVQSPSFSKSKDLCLNGVELAFNPISGNLGKEFSTSPPVGWDYESQMCQSTKLANEMEAFILNPQRLLDKLIVACPNTCESLVPRSDLQQHLITRCRGEKAPPINTHDCKSGIWRSVRGSHADQASIEPGKVTTIEIERGHHDMGLSIVGGLDTPLVCVLVQEVLPHGAAAADGRLRPGDQILELNGEDLARRTHEDACICLAQPLPAVTLTVYREKADDSGGGGHGGRQQQAGQQEVVKITLKKTLGKQIGIKLGKVRERPGLYILDILPGSIAEADGRLRRDDQIVEINSLNAETIAQEQATHIIKSSVQSVSLVLCRRCPATVPLPQPASPPPPPAVHGPKPMPMYYPFTQCPQHVIHVTKDPSDCLGISISGGRANGHGDCPIYVTNVHTNGCLATSNQIRKGDILLSINGCPLLGLSHSEAVAVLKRCSEARAVTLTLLHGHGDYDSDDTFIPTWNYWLSLPSLCHSTRSVRITRCPSGGLGFSIVGGCKIGLHRVPIFVKSLMLNSNTCTQGRLRSGDMLVEVDGYSMEGVSHSQAVAILKSTGSTVMLTVVSWPGTVV